MDENHKKLAYAVKGIAIVVSTYYTELLANGMAKEMAEALVTDLHNRLIDELIERGVEGLK